MDPHLIPARLDPDVPAWTQTVQAFLAEKERRSGSKRTVEGYARMLWPFLTNVGSPARVTPAHVLAWAHGIGASGREPSSATVGARIACLSSYYRFLIRMNIASANPCDALERPKTVASLARGLTAEQIRRLLAVVPASVASNVPNSFGLPRIGWLNTLKASALNTTLNRSVTARFLWREKSMFQ